MGGRGWEEGVGKGLGRGWEEGVGRKEGLGGKGWEEGVGKGLGVIINPDPILPTR